MSSKAWKKQYSAKVATDCINVFEHISDTPITDEQLANGLLQGDGLRIFVWDEVSDAIYNENVGTAIGRIETAIEELQQVLNVLNKEMNKPTTT